MGGEVKTCLKYFKGSLVSGSDEGAGRGEWEVVGVEGAERTEEGLLKVKEDTKFGLNVITKVGELVYKAAVLRRGGVGREEFKEKRRESMGEKRG